VSWVTINKMSESCKTGRWAAPSFHAPTPSPPTPSHPSQSAATRPRILPWDKAPQVHETMRTYPRRSKSANAVLSDKRSDVATYPYRKLYTRHSIRPETRHAGSERPARQSPDLVVNAQQQQSPSRPPTRSLRRGRLQILLEKAQKEGPLQVGEMQKEVGEKNTNIPQYDESGQRRRMPLQEQNKNAPLPQMLRTPPKKAVQPTKRLVLSMPSHLVAGSAKFGNPVGSRAAYSCHMRTNLTCL